jgi:hypothetical protein
LPALFLACFFCATAILAASPVTTNSAGALVLTNQFGDLDNDGQVDVRDMVRLTHHLNVTIPLSPALTNHADLNQDGAITTTDRTILANMIACRNTKADEDFEGDELSNAQEMQRGTNPLLPDSDSDGWLDGWEVAEGTNPLDAQSGLTLFVVARPSVQVIHPLIQDTDTNTLGVVLARPPVTVTNPPPP